MSELDKKLDEILDYMGSSYYPAHEYPESFEPQNIELRKTALPEIKQAFIDDGWLQPPNMDVYLTAAFDAFIKAGGDEKDFVLMSRKDWNVNSKLAGVMTGKEFYDRFIKEVDHEKYEHTGNPTEVHNKLMMIVLGAAKRAAGITNEGLSKVVKRGQPTLYGMPVSYFSVDELKEYRDTGMIQCMAGKEWRQRFDKAAKEGAGTMDPSDFYDAKIPTWIPTESEKRDQ